MAVIGTAAGAQEGRDAGAEPGPAVVSPDAGGGGDIIEAGEWDGDGPAPRDQVILDDLIVDGSICVGFDCVNGESFGFDTLRLKENNLRIRFVDTSTSASFPTNDWQITVNDTSNGGRNMFAIDDIDGARTPFLIEAGARTNALYVEADGDLGLGTNNPVADIHIQTGNTPTLRLHQDGSSGFTQQVWDVAGNEANFFIRDATNGSKLVFRIRPGAPTSAIDIAANGRIGLFNSSPVTDVHVLDGDGDGFATMRLTNPAAGAQNWDIRSTTSGGLAITKGGTGQIELEIDVNGNVTIRGNLTVNGNITCTGQINGVNC